jgi:hypothetical protein
MGRGATVNEHIRAAKWRVEMEERGAVSTSQEWWKEQAWCVAVRGGVCRAEHVMNMVSGAGNQG